MRLIINKISNDELLFLLLCLLSKKYKRVQKEIIKYLIKKYDLPFRESDSLLLSYIKEDDIIGLSEEKLSLIKDYKRGNNYRFCLTPYFELWENNNIQLYLFVI